MNLSVRCDNDMVTGFSEGNQYAAWIKFVVKFNPMPQVRVDLTPRSLVSVINTSYTFNVVKDGLDYGFESPNQTVENEKINIEYSSSGFYLSEIFISPSYALTTKADSSGYIRMPDGNTYRIVIYNREQSEAVAIAACGSDRLATVDEARGFIRAFGSQDVDLSDEPTIPGSGQVTFSRCLPPKETLEAMGLQVISGISGLYLYPETKWNLTDMALCVKE